MKLLSKVKLVKADITKLKVDCIVNAANENLYGPKARKPFRGIAEAIRLVAGDELLEECKKVTRAGGCRTGKAVITGGYKLPAKHVIHAVGPQKSMHGINFDLLSSAYTSSLEVMRENDLRSIAFCCISTGLFGHPNEESAQVAFESVRDWVLNNWADVDEVTFCTWLDKDYDIYKELLGQYEKTQAATKLYSMK